MKRCTLLLATALVLAGCGGPNEQAGAERDKAAAASIGKPYDGSGPNERIGEAQDRANRAAVHARDATTDAIKRQADVEADRLEEQARAIRKAASDRAEHIAAPAATRPSETM